MIINSVGGLGRLIEFKTCQKKSAITLGGRKRPQAAFVVSCSLAHTRENRGSSVGQEAALEPATSEKKTHKKKKKKYRENRRNTWKYKTEAPDKSSGKGVIVVMIIITFITRLSSGWLYSKHSSCGPPRC